MAYKDVRSETFIMYIEKMSFKVKFLKAIKTYKRRLSDIHNVQQQNYSNVLLKSLKRLGVADSEF